MFPYAPARRRLAIAALTALAACDHESSSTGLDEVTEQVSSASPVSPAPGAQAKAAADAPAPERAALPVLSGPHFGVYDLLTNGAHAHRSGEGVGVDVDATAYDFVRYINGNYPKEWMLGLAPGDHPGAGLKGRKGTVWFPSRVIEGAALALRVHNPARGDNTLKASLNGVALAPTELEAGWNEIEVAIPAGALAAENALDLEFTNLGRYDKTLAGGALARLRVLGSTAPARLAQEPAAARAAADPTADPDAAAPAAAESAAAGEPAARVGLSTWPAARALPAGRSIELGARDALYWHLWALPGAKLALRLKGAAGCGARVEVERESGAPEVTSLTIPNIAAGRATETFAPVEVGGEGVRRVVLSGLEGCTAPILIERAELVVPGERPTPSAIPRPKHVLFWMIDTLRADHLPFYRPESGVKAPALARLAEGGARFDLAYVQGNESKVSHASLFSGMYPNKHRVLAKGSLKPHHEILPEAMKAADYRTGAHISNGYISKPWGFAQGWDHFINNLRDGWRIDGHGMAQHAIDWATKNKERDFFLYIGTIDPHVTYRRHDDLIGLYDEPGYSGRYDRSCSGEDLGKIKGGGLKPNERDRARIQNLYKNEITFNDQAFAKVRAAFEEMGIWDDTLVVVTADHGDEFWEHGSVGHGHSVYQELVHVPLLMHYPKGIPAGTVVTAGVDVLDIYPTLVDLAGAARPEGLQGKSLAPLLFRTNADYPEPAVATRYLGHYGMQMRDFKLYLRKGDYALYDRSSDPMEQDDAKASHPLAARWLLDSMALFRAHRSEWDKASWGVASNLSKAGAEAVREGTAAKK